MGVGDGVLNLWVVRGKGKRESEARFLLWDWGFFS